MANTNMKKCSASLVFRDSQIKNTRGYPTNMAKTRKTNSSNISEDMEQLELSYSFIIGCSVKCTIMLEKHLAASYKVKHIPAL